jgi:nitrogen regulatory protein PII
MSGHQAKLVTIIVSFDLKSRVEDELERRGLHGYSIGIVEGRGRHGHQAGGFLVPKNSQFIVVVSSESADGILEWVDTTLSKDHPAIAFAHEIKVVPSSIAR